MNECRYSEFASTKETCSILHVAPETLRKWEKGGKIETSRSVGNQRRYNLRKFFGEKPDIKRKNIVYARVSGAGQADDLKRQVELLAREFPDYTIIKDIGSGLNFKRKGLKTLVGYLVRGEVQELVVTHKDRLCRFGFELFSLLMSIGNPEGKIVVLDRKETTPESEMVEDILSILTSFSGRLHGLRSHQSAIKKLFQDENHKVETESRGEESTAEDV